MTIERLKVKENYELIFPNGDHTITELIKIQTYPATGLPPDYIFEYISGASTITLHSPLGKAFPLPMGLLKYVDIKEIKNKEGKND